MPHRVSISRGHGFWRDAVVLCPWWRSPHCLRASHRRPRRTSATSARRGRRRRLSSRTQPRRGCSKHPAKRASRLTAVARWASDLHPLTRFSTTPRTLRLVPQVLSDLRAQQARAAVAGVSSLAAGVSAAQESEAVALLRAQLNRAEAEIAALRRQAPPGSVAATGTCQRCADLVRGGARRGTKCSGSSPVCGSEGMGS